MAVNRVPVLKRCRSLGLDPIYLGIDKKSTRQLKRANRKVSEYGLQLKEKQKAKFIYGVLEARQIVDHKHVLVNGKCVNIPSYLCKAGDTIEIREKSKGSERYKGILEVTGGRLVPEWIDADQENLKGVIKELPTREQIDVPVNEMLIVELYSK